MRRLFLLLSSLIFIASCDEGSVNRSTVNGAMFEEIELEGVPESGSEAKTAEIKVIAKNANQYRYRIQNVKTSNDLDCAPADGYSGEIGINTPINIELDKFENGMIGLCLIVKVKDTWLANTFARKFFWIKGVSGQTAGAKELVGLELKSTSPVLPKGASLALSAHAVYSDGSTSIVTDKIKWETSNAKIATVTDVAGSKGQLTAFALGTVQISATLEGKKASISIAVIDAEISELILSNIPSGSLPKGTSVALKAIGKFSDKSSVDITGMVTWKTSAPNVALVMDAMTNKGIVMAMAAGTTTISAEFRGKKITQSITVSNAIAKSLAINANQNSVSLGALMPVTVLATFSDNQQLDVTADATWTFEDPTVIGVEIGSATNLKGLALGTTKVSAVYAGASGTRGFDVVAKTLEEISITLTSTTVYKGASTGAKAEGTYSDGTTSDITSSVLWSSDSSSIADISNVSGTKGVVTGISVGNANLSASLGDVSESIAVTVDAAVVKSIFISPNVVAAGLGQTTNLTATARYTDNQDEDITTTAIWASDDPSIAVVDSTGEVTATGSGSTNITASIGTVEGSAKFLGYATADVASLTINAESPTVAMGAFTRYSVIGTFNDSTIADLTSAVSWSSSDTGVATISNTGFNKGKAEGLTAGSTTITATYGSASTQTSLTVTNATLDYGAAALDAKL